MKINNSQPKMEEKQTNQVLSSLLQQNGLNQTQLAEKVGINKSYINRILHNKETAPTKLKIKIAKILGVDSRMIWDDGK